MFSAHSKQAPNTKKCAGAFVLVLNILTTQSTLARPQVRKPSGKVRGKKLPPEERNDCCEKGKLYNTYKCSPPVSKSTKAILTLNSFDTNGDVPSTCDDKYHSDVTPIVALSMGWFSGGRRCLQNIVISSNGRNIKTTVIDEYDSIMGCDADNGYQPPCGNNIVEASKAIWEALGVPKDDWNVLNITWSDVQLAARAIHHFSLDDFESFLVRKKRYMY